MHFTMGTIALFIIASYWYFYHKACVNNEFYTLNETNYALYNTEVGEPLGKMIWITFVVLAVILFCVGTIMLRKLRLYYRGFFSMFGRHLWIANILLTLPLTFRAVIDALRLNPTWTAYWFEGNYYRLAIYNMLVFTLCTYIPMLTQISSLIFGFVRNKQVKIMGKNAGIHKDLIDAENNENESDDNDSSDTCSNNTGMISINSKKSANSFFDPPIENYRFYHQNGAVSGQQNSFGGSLRLLNNNENRAVFMLR